jgi:hypothetical protein
LEFCMSEQHTPGPWQWSHNGASTHDTHCIEISGGDRIGNVAYCQSYTGDGYDDRSETIANARLIAAAPELLEALQAIVKSLADHDDEGMVEHAAQMVAARAAIAKATGEQA